MSEIKKRRFETRRPGQNQEETMKKTKTNKHGFTLIELMIVVAIIGILAAVAIPAFVNYMKRAKTSEATLNLKSIVEGAVSYYDTKGQYLPNTVAATPDAIPKPEPKAVLDSEWTDDAWTQLGWRPHKAFLYRYSFDNDCGDATSCIGKDDEIIGTATAIGDLDGDETKSTFSRDITRTAGGNAIIGEVSITDELE
jgi:type IV pilus assembly protein PilA